MLDVEKIENDSINNERSITEKLVLVHTVHEVHVHNQVIYLDLPSEEARINNLINYIAVGCVQLARQFCSTSQKPSVSQETT
ncbi:14750_t:CDS:2 [Dentiscutata erythropus]|uniref:14750_t:CDS:1 n=1 Tax=Dentiscutata erythropus TaxID=1348616 RepID=A0A9N9AWT2_9GLOM|nr:14750_t:CDS:2 [Dentiscutata erythropus]